eukprot:952131-Pyramimonas_sp.AAC.1
MMPRWPREAPRRLRRELQTCENRRTPRGMVHFNGSPLLGCESLRRGPRTPRRGFCCPPWPPGARRGHAGPCLDLRAP